MKNSTMPLRPLGKTGLRVPPIVFGTSCLGNLYQAMPDKTKLASIAEMFRAVGPAVVLDTAGKYGAGLALEVIGASLAKLGVGRDDVVISNKLGWYRVPLRGPEPTFERGVWVGIGHDAEARIGYRGMYECWEQGRELLGGDWSPQMVSVHDPDEYLAAATGPADLQRRFHNVTEAYRALFELKARGEVKAVGVGAKDWRVIRRIAEQVELDWVMFACSLTVYSHPPELLDFIASLEARGVGMVNSAVFHAGFLTGGPWFDYRKPDPVKEAPLFAWRDRYHAVCRRFAVDPAHVAVKFGLAVPGVAAVALNTARPERIGENVASVLAEIPPGLWRALKDEGLVSRDFPYLG